MNWMNEYEIEDAQNWFVHKDTPNLQKGALILARLVGWTNSFSDGWPYWQKPAKAADKLMTLVLEARDGQRRGIHDDVTEAQLRAALSPIKAMLTREKIEDGVKTAIFE